MSILITSPLGPRAPAWLVIALLIVASFEGLYTHAYHDTLANGLPTICYGVTKYDRPVSMDDVYTPQQCKDMLAQDLPKYNAILDKCIKVPISNHTRAAAVSLAYNVGAETVCKSSFVRHLNAKDPSACDYILLYNQAGDKVIRGLERRREAERKLCYEKD